MTRYGAQYGPDLTFLGVDACDLADPSSYADADVVIGSRWAPGLAGQTKDTVSARSPT